MPNSKNQLKIFGLDVFYEVNNDTSKVAIGFIGDSKMEESVQKQIVDKIGNYLVAEGFIEIPPDTQKNVWHFSFQWIRSSDGIRKV